VVVTDRFTRARRSRRKDPKRALLRRADTERDTAYSIGFGTKREKSALIEKKPITLARVKSLEKPIDGDGIEGKPPRRR
jgi:hypothetical protein